MFNYLNFFKQIRNTFYFSITSIFLSGCMTTPVNKIPDSDFVWKDKKSNLNYQQVYRNLKEGLDLCSNELYFSDKSELFTDIKQASIILYLKSPILGQMDGVYGKIEIKADNNLTIVKIGTQSIYSKPIIGKFKTNDILAQFVDGNYTCSGESLKI